MDISWLKIIANNDNLTMNWVSCSISRPKPYFNLLHLPPVVGQVAENVFFHFFSVARFWAVWFNKNFDRFMV